MKKQNILTKTVGAIMLMSIAFAAIASSPKPPESFCGIKFGVVHEGRTSIKLERPFRYCTSASISKTPKGKKIFSIKVHGKTDGPMSEEDMRTELSRMSEIIGQHFGVIMNPGGLIGSYGYSDQSFKIKVAGRRDKTGITYFWVSIERLDILNADIESTPHIQPLSGSDGANVL